MTNDLPATIRLVGQISVARGTRVVDPRIVGGPRCVEVLAYLTVNRHRDVPLDELALLLWPDARPRTWKSVLRGVISKVRDVLDAADIAGNSVTSRSGMVRLVLPPDTDVDLETARAACHRNDASPSQQAHDARRALHILNEPVLVGATGNWADGIRTEFDILRLTALELDASASLELGEFDNAVSSAESLLAADPLRESVYRVAMRGYMGLGDRAQALGAASRCRTVLAEQLGVDPSPATRELFLEALDDAATARPVEQRAVGREFVGREREMTEIGSALESAAAGHGRFVVVSGPAGVGKTSLMRAARDLGRRRGMDVVAGRCGEHAVIPYEPLVDAVSRDLDARGVAGAREWLRENGTSILSIVPGAARRFGDLIPAHGHDDRAGAAEAVTEWLVGPARRGSTLLVIDDVQWASGATSTLIRHLARETPGRRLCIMVGVRDENHRSPELQSTLAAARRTEGYREIRLGGLSVAAVRDLVRGRQSPFDADALVERTGGSALLIAAVLAAHEREPGGSIPDTVADAVRIARSTLSCDAVTLLELCSVLGSTIPRPVLRAASTIPDDIRFAETLDELARVNFVIAGETDDDLTMRHALVQKDINDSIPGARRAQLHSDVARALIALGADTTADELGRIAYHFGRSLDSDRSEAAHYARRAGDSAYAVSAYEDAVSGYRIALRRMVPRGDSEERCRLLVDLVRAQRKCLDRSYRSTLFDAIAMARRLGLHDLQIDATLADTMDGATLFQIFEPLPERVHSLQEALHILEDTGRQDGPEASRLLTQLATELSWNDDWKERRRLLERAAAIAHSVGDGAALEGALVAMLRSLLVPQCWDLRHEALTRLDDLRATSPLRRRDPSVAAVQARSQVDFGYLDRAASTLAAVTSADIAADDEMSWVMACSRFGLDVTAGRLVRAETVLDRIRTPPDAPVGSHTYGRDHTSILALRMFRGDLSYFVGISDEMATMFDLIAAFRPAVAIAHLDVGEVEEARRLMDWYDAQHIAAVPAGLLWLMTMAFIGRAAAGVGNVAVCEDIHARLLPFAQLTVSMSPATFGVVHHHLADMSLTAGHLERAGRHLHAARRLHLQRGYAAWSAEDAYLGLRIDHARTGRVSDRAVRSARERADAIGATSVRRRIDAFCASVEGHR
ncbi:ATP-binding protein [Rhodococcus sp. MEB064]|uniref:ATP-binding protein n=1 Tax=Rhodococcus sp. MEB064 TaxID=1587522 RepID=UPI0005AC4824|nr:AAA family ATPase [Rhodococcus sp. MEB064]KIQ19322.1 hypothetical protein RU01_05020 [Rhodococcus sp. MEB064]